MAIPVKKKNPVRKAGSSERRKSTRNSGWALRREGRLQVLTSHPLDELDWLAYGFSTRQGGARALGDDSRAAGSPKIRNRILNLGFTDWDTPERVAANRRSFFRAIDAHKMRVVTLKQIHSDIIHCVKAADSDRGTQAPRAYFARKAVNSTLVDAPVADAPVADAPVADVLITRERGVLLVVQTADCVPILLADTKTHSVAAIHSGWRGTLRRVAEKTLGRMQIEFGTRPKDVIAAIGPAIGRCCYEVGSDVAREFHSQFPDAREWFDGPFDALAAGENDPNWLPWLTMMPPGHQPPSPAVQLDLIAANRAILSNAGVPPGRIFSSDFCTACRTDLFFSYRRERVTGRLMAAIGIR